MLNKQDPRQKIYQNLQKNLSKISDNILSKGNKMPKPLTNQNMRGLPVSSFMQPGKNNK